IVKVTDEELAFLTDMDNEIDGVRKIFDYAVNAKILLVTKGKNGACAYDRSLATCESKAVDVKVVDTTGAGDCFAGCILYALTAGEASLDLDGIRAAVDFASVGCGVVVGKKGAMEAMPTKQDIEQLKKQLIEKRFFE
ncbi:MAG: PfkB family carbohydrate kinase, partial [Clostridia bacterium]